MKDWTGDSNSVFKTLGASNHSKSERHSEDYYATDPKAIDALVKAYELPNKIWECACGEGHLAKRLTELGYNVVATDLVDRGYGEGGVDFLAQMAMPEDCNCILTNPPFKYSTPFITHALNLLPVGGVLAVFLRTLCLEGQERYEKIYKHNPPRCVFQFARRIKCAKNGEFDVVSGVQAYGWFLWEKGYKGEAIIKWI